MKTASCKTKSCVYVHFSSHQLWHCKLYPRPDERATVINSAAVLLAFHCELTPLPEIIFCYILVKPPKQGIICHCWQAR
jgi:hypothetical protein